MRGTRRLRPFTLLVVLAAQIPASCAAPLGPGYSIKKQSLEVHYLAGDSPRLEIRARYQLKNTGNRNLAALEVDLPGEKNYGRKNLRVTLDGGAVSTSTGAADDDVRISFGQPWAKKEERELILDYELTEQSAENRGILLAADSFFLSSAGWFPVLRSPEGLFGESGDREKPLELSVRVPPGFLAHASGRARGVRKESGELLYRFRIGNEDFNPFVVAGRYHEQRFHNPSATIVFWTLKQTMTKDDLHYAGDYISNSVKVFENEFGKLHKKADPYWIVEMHLFPPEARASGTNLITGAGTRIVAMSLPFPGGSGVDALSPEAVLSNVEHSLAASWFAFLAHPGPEGDSLLRGAGSNYATRVAVETSGQNEKRNEHVKESLLKYLAALGRGAKEKPLLLVIPADPESEYELGTSKATLFLAALEDRCGKENLHHALRHMVQSLRGSTYGYAELRSALEQECHQDLGPMFREWLTETGIPADFRQRYETKP